MAIYMKCAFLNCFPLWGSIHVEGERKRNHHRKNDNGCLCNYIKCQGHRNAERMSRLRPLSLIFILRSLKDNFQCEALVSVITCNLGRSQDASHSHMFMLNKQASEGINRVNSYPSLQGTKHQKKSFAFVSAQCVIGFFCEHTFNSLFRAC